MLRRVKTKSRNAVKHGREKVIDSVGDEDRNDNEEIAFLCE